MNATQSSAPPSGEGAEQSPGAGWYPNPDGPGRRYFDGEIWTDNYDPGDQPAAPSLSEVLWALSLAFGVAGGLCAAFGYPLMLYVIPLSFGGAGLVLAFVARIAPGRARPGWAILAVIGAVIALASGIDSRGEFKDSTESFNAAIENLRD